MFHPRYTLTNKIVGWLTAIAEARAVIARARLLPRQELQLRHQALVRMTHSSTGIEGNRLNLPQVAAVYARRRVEAPARDIYEAKNYLQALRYIGRVVEEKKPFSRSIFLKIHRLVTAQTLPEGQAGCFRRSQVFVVRRKLGRPPEIVYTAPAAARVPALTDDLIAWIQKAVKEEINPIIVAGIVHQEIAAIHPFSDGNGRTARAVATLILYQRGYDFRRLFALEDYYNHDRARYYRAIATGKKYLAGADLTPWLEYFVRGFQEEIDGVKAKVLALSRRQVDLSGAAQIYLDPASLKIIDFLEQVKKITTADVMDILACPRRTAQWHLQRLKKLKMIVLVGRGPTSAYVLAK